MDPGVEVKPTSFGPASGPVTQTLLAATSTMEGSTAASSLLPSAAAASWEEEEFEPHRQASPESTSSASESPVADLFRAENANALNSTWVPIYNDPFDITRSIFYGTLPPYCRR